MLCDRVHCKILFRLADSCPAICAGPMEEGPSLELCIAVWAEVGLSAERHATLDNQAISISDNRQDSAVGREALKDVIKDFRDTPAEERPRRIGVLIKAFQAEVDALTRRQAFAEDAFLNLYRPLADAPDPHASLLAAAAEIGRLRPEAAAAAVAADGLRRELAHIDATGGGDGENE